MRVDGDRLLVPLGHRQAERVEIVFRLSPNQKFLRRELDQDGTQEMLDLEGSFLHLTDQLLVGDAFGGGVLVDDEDRLADLKEKRQIIIATHNPYVVENIRPDAILYSLNEVKEGMPLKHTLSELREEDIKKLMC